MRPANCYHNRAKISKAKLRCVLRLFALDLTASDTARLTRLSRRVVKQFVPASAPPVAGLEPGAGRARRGR